MLAGYHALTIRTPERAIPRLRSALAHLPDAWWKQPDAAELRLLLGQNLLVAGDAEDAKAKIEAALGGVVVLQSACSWP